MRLLHYSKDPLPANLCDMLQDVGPKPRGLWVSVEGEDDWKSWCIRERFWLVNLTTETEIKLLPDAKIIHLSCAGDIDDFGDKYTAVEYPYNGFPGAFINWPQIATEYDGIIIAPYVWSRRLASRCFWYYGWDCASGCIWNIGAIESMKTLNRSTK